MSKIVPFLAVIILLGTVVLTSCAKKTSGDFGIYLVDSGELVLSDKDILTYRQDTHTFALTKQGIERWNSFFPNSGRSLSDDKLNSKSFVVKLDGQEMYRGTFSSFLSSYLYPGVSILTMPLTYDSFNEISIEYHDLSDDSSVTTDPRNNPEIISYFEKCGLLK